MRDSTAYEGEIIAATAPKQHAAAGAGGPAVGADAAAEPRGGGQAVEGVEQAGHSAGRGRDSRGAQRAGGVQQWDGDRWQRPAESRGRGGERGGGARSGGRGGARERGERRRGPSRESRLEGVRLADMVEWLQRDLGWREMYRRTGIRAFDERPSVKSSLKMLRKPGNEWTRRRVEDMYLDRMATLEWE